MHNDVLPTTTSLQIVRVDQGGVNERILAREAKVDYRRVEAASVKMPACFTSAEGKRLFVRMFATLQLNAHFISVIARTRLDHQDVARVEATIRARMESVAEKLNDSIDAAEAMFKAHGITSVATYDTVPLDLQVGVLSSSGRRFLEVLGKLDQLMPLLQTLEIHEILTTQEVDAQRAALKRQVRDIANGTRSFATGLKRRMSALGGSRVPVGDDGPTPATESDGTDEAQHSTSAPAGDGSGIQGLDAVPLDAVVIEPV